MAVLLIGQFYLVFHFFILFFKLCYSISDFPLVLLVSYDGFRYDYLSKGHFPHFQYLIDNGIRAPWIINTFTTITIPNHHSIVTGMYQETHGMVGNTIYDPYIFNETFTLNNSEPKWWNTGAEPIWVTNQKVNPKKRWSGSMLWYGGNVEINGQIPKRFKGWDESNDTLSWYERVDQLIEWYRDPINPINLGLLYIEEPDEAGHAAGPDSLLVLEKLHELNNLTGYLIDRLKKFHLFDKMNIIMTSDHGMVAVNSSYLVNLDHYIDSSLYRAIGGSPVSNIIPVEGKEDEVYNFLTKVPHIKVYRKANVPTNYHYSNHRRIQPIVIEAEQGWIYIYNNYTKKLNTGFHGYNNSWMPMHPYFIAHGPAFKKNYTSRPFKNVDIYPLMCLILKIRENLNNGSLDIIKHILKDEYLIPYIKPPNRNPLYSWTGAFTIIVIVFIIGVIIGALVTFKQYLPGFHKRQSISSIGSSRPYRDLSQGHSESKEPLLMHEEE